MGRVGLRPGVMAKRGLSSASKCEPPGTTCQAPRLLHLRPRMAPQGPCLQPSSAPQGSAPRVLLAGPLCPEPAVSRGPATSLHPLVLSHVLFRSSATYNPADLFSSSQALCLMRGCWGGRHKLQASPFSSGLWGGDSVRAPACARPRGRRSGPAPQAAGGPQAVRLSNSPSHRHSELPGVASLPLSPVCEVGNVNSHLTDEETEAQGGSPIFAVAQDEAGRGPSGQSPLASCWPGLHVWA